MPATALAPPSNATNLPGLCPKPGFVPCPGNTPKLRENANQQLALIEAALGRPLRRVLSAVAVLLLLAVSAGAQTVTATATDLAVNWDAPVDPATGLADYVEYYLVKQGAQPGGTLATLRVDSGREYRFVPVDPAKVYYFRVAACKVVRVSGKDDPMCSPDSNEANTSAFVVPADSCSGAVVLAVGDWTRTANPGDSGRVLLTLGRSKQPVTEVWTFLDGAPVPSTSANPNPKSGDDLRGIAGVYFVVPQGPGAHKVSVSAKTAAGCEDGASRPMTLVVQ